MPRYFFTVEDGLCIPDFGGTELCDVDAARKEAALRCQAFATDQPRAFAAGGPWRMDVSDEWGLLLFQHAFAKTPAPRGGTS